MHIHWKNKLFLSVQILDLYNYKAKKQLNYLDIHLIGITCILISSQIKDFFPININDIINKIGYKLFIKKDFINKEIEILLKI